MKKHFSLAASRHGHQIEPLVPLAIVCLVIGMILPAIGKHSAMTRHRKMLSTFDPGVAVYESNAGVVLENGIYYRVTNRYDFGRKTVRGSYSEDGYYGKYEIPDAEWIKVATKLKAALEKAIKEDKNAPIWLPERLAEVTQFLERENVPAPSPAGP